MRSAFSGAEEVIDGLLSIPDAEDHLDGFPAILKEISRTFANRPKLKNVLRLQEL